MGFRNNGPPIISLFGQSHLEENSYTTLEGVEISAPIPQLFFLSGVSLLGYSDKNSTRRRLRKSARILFPALQHNLLPVHKVPGKRSKIQAVFHGGESELGDIYIAACTYPSNVTQYCDGFRHRRVLLFHLWLFCLREMHEEGGGARQICCSIFLLLFSFAPFAA